VVQDAAGDTVFAQNAAGAMGINRVTWNLRGRPAAVVAATLSPASLRDSVVNQRKLLITLDSLEKEGTVPKAMIDRVRTALNSPEGLMGMVQQMMGAFGGGGGRAGAGPVRFVDRPGEQTAGRGAGPGAGGRAGGEGAAPAAEAMPDMGQLSGLFRAFQGYGDRLFTQGRGQAALVETGSYKVSLVIGGKVEQSQSLRVERVSGGASGLGGFFEGR
jgi:hypothetical protein